MATKGISVQASRFALLKVEDDEEEMEQQSKAKQAQKNQQQASAAKKKNKKKKKAEAAAESAQLRNLAFGGPPSSGKGGRKHTNSGGAGGDSRSPPSDSQWEHWKKVDDEFTSETYEADLQQAILQSKLEFEKKDTTVTTNGHDTKSEGKQGKKKKKSKGTMSLEEFNQLPPEQPKGSDSEPEELYEIMPGKPKIETKIENPDDKFFDNVKQDAQQMIRKEIIQEEYRKQYALESAQSQRHAVEIDTRDKEISRLTKENEKLKEEYKQVKKRNQQLCHILAQGEMKDKKAVLVENEELKSIQAELTEEVGSLTRELEKERSSVHSLKEEIAKLKSKQGGKS